MELSVEVSNYEKGVAVKYPNIVVDFGCEKNYEIYDGDSFDDLIEPVNEILPEDFYVDANYTTCGFDVVTHIDYETYKGSIDLVAEMNDIVPDSDQEPERTDYRSFHMTMEDGTTIHVDEWEQCQDGDWYEREHYFKCAGDQESLEEALNMYYKSLPNETDVQKNKIQKFHLSGDLSFSTVIRNIEVIAVYNCKSVPSTTQSVDECNDVKNDETSTRKRKSDEQQDPLVSLSSDKPNKKFKSDAGDTVEGSSVQSIDDVGHVTVFPMVTEDQIVQLSKTHSGLPYGGWVRDTKILNTKAKDMDIWFLSEENAMLFVNDSITNHGAFMYRDLKNTDRDSSSHLYPFQRVCLNFNHDNEKQYINVDVIISKDFPVNDFDVNLLVFEDNEVRLGVPTMVKYNGTKENVIQAIVDRKMTPFPEYKVILDKHQNVTELRMDTFVNRGWTIPYNRWSSEARHYRFLLMKSVCGNQLLSIFMPLIHGWHRHIRSQKSLPICLKRTDNTENYKTQIKLMVEYLRLVCNGIVIVVQDEPIQELEDANNMTDTDVYFFTVKQDTSGGLCESTQDMVRIYHSVTD